MALNATKTQLTFKTAELRNNWRLIFPSKNFFIKLLEFKNLELNQHFKKTSNVKTDNEINLVFTRGVIRKSKMF